MQSHSSYSPHTYDDIGDITDYIALLKPRVMSLVVFTGFVGLWLAPGTLHPYLAFTTILCIALGAGASGAINMWCERESDGKMDRTRNRPLPAGRLDPDSALAYGITLAVLSVLVLGLAVNKVAAFWLAISILFYVFVYTLWLKPRTPQNIVIGGAAGAFPPLIGWSAVTGDLSTLPWLLFAITFFWTPPHFWSLALYKCKDYAAAGIPMLPVIKGQAHTKIHILGYTLLLGPLALSPWYLGYAGWIYGTTAFALSLGFIVLAVQMARTEGEHYPRLTFKYSLFYLFIIYLVLMIDRSLI